MYNKREEDLENLKAGRIALIGLLIMYIGVLITALTYIINNIRGEGFLQMLAVTLVSALFIPAIYKCIQLDSELIKKEIEDMKNDI